MARKRPPEEPDNHERWLVSYADFITLLFAFFVVMYAISQLNEGKYKQLTQSLIQAFVSNSPNRQQQVPKEGQLNHAAIPQSPIQPLPIPKGENALKKHQAGKMQKMANDLSHVLEPLIKEGQVRVTESKRGIAVEINASILFDPAQAKLSSDSAKALSIVAEMLAKADNLIQIEGYTDHLPIHSTQYPSNWELSSARASSVVRVFIDSGVAPSRLVVVGYAENRPLADNSTPEGRQRNRRVSVMILADNKDEVAVLPAQQLSAPKAAPPR